MALKVGHISQLFGIFLLGRNTHGCAHTSSNNYYNKKEFSKVNSFLYDTFLHYVLSIIWDDIKCLMKRQNRTWGIMFIC